MEGLLRVFLFRHRLPIGVLAPVEEAGDAAERDKDQEKILSRYPANRGEQRSAATNHRRGDHFFRFPPRRMIRDRVQKPRSCRYRLHSGTTAVFRPGLDAGSQQRLREFH